MLQHFNGILLLHALNPCVATYILPLFLYFWHCHPYILQHFNGILLLHACCNILMEYYCCMPSIPVLLHIYCTCFSTFGTVIPTSFNILMEMFLYTCFTDFRCILACKYNALCVCATPTYFAAHGHMKRT